MKLFLLFLKGLFMDLLNIILIIALIIELTLFFVTMMKKNSSEQVKKELEEQKELYKEYLAAFRKNFKAQLDNIEIVDGNECKEQ